MSLRGNANKIIISQASYFTDFIYGKEHINLFEMCNNFALVVFIKLFSLQPRAKCKYNDFTLTMSG